MSDEMVDKSYVDEERKKSEEELVEAAIERLIEWRRMLDDQGMDEGWIQKKCVEAENSVVGTLMSYGISFRMIAVIFVKMWEAADRKEEVNHNVG